MPLGKNEYGQDVWMSNNAAEHNDKPTTAEKLMSVERAMTTPKQHVHERGTPINIDHNPTGRMAWRCVDECKDAPYWEADWYWFELGRGVGDATRT